MLIPFDWHIHTHNSPCGNEQATLELIAEEAYAAGMLCIGFSDHIHTGATLDLIEASRREFDELNPPIQCLFGVEVSVVRDWDIEEDAKKDVPFYRYNDGPELPPTILLNEEIMQRFSIEYVIGSTHWLLGALQDPQAMIDSFHRQNVMLAQHPLVNIIAHPWWHQCPEDGFGGRLMVPWFEDFSVIPEKYHREFADAVVENGKAVEISVGFLHKNPLMNERFRKLYREFLVELRERGVQFTVGGDTHDAGYDYILDLAQSELEMLDLTADDLWRPDGVTIGATKTDAGK